MNFYDASQWIKQTTYSYTINYPIPWRNTYKKRFLTLAIALITGEFEIPSGSKAGLRHCSSAEQSRKHVYELIMMIPGGLRAETAHFLKVLILGEVSSWKTFQYLGIDKTARTPDFPWEMYERKYEPLSLKLDVWTKRIYFIFSVNLKWQHGRITHFIELPG